MTIRQRLRAAAPFYVYVLLLVTVVLFLLIRLIKIKGVPVHVDETIYINWARYASAGQLGMSFTMGVPPLHQIAMVPFVKLFSDPLVGARVCSVCFGFVSLVTIVLMGRDLHSLEMGAWAGLFWAVCPYIAWYERLGLIESMLISLSLIAVYFAVRAAVTVNMLWLIGTALFLGFALWTKLTAQLFFLVIPFAYLLRGPGQKGREGRRPVVKWVASVVLALLASYGMYNLLRLSPLFSRLAMYTRKHTLTLGQLLEDPFQVFPSNMRQIWVLMWKMAVPLLLIVCVLGILAGLLLKWRGSYFLLWWFGITVLAVAFITKQPAGSRYYVILLPPLILGAGYAVVELPRRAWALIRKVPGAVARPALAVGLIVILVAVAVGIALPAGRADANIGYHPEKVANVQAWSWGWGYDEAFARIAELRKSGNVSFTCNDSFTVTLMKLYGVKTIPYRAALETARSGGGPIYFLGPARMAGKIPMEDVERYPDPQNPFGVVLGRLR